MKKDIIIPEVKDVYVAVIQQHNEENDCNEWHTYLINDKDVDLDMVIILSGGYSEDKVTSNMRKKIDSLPAKSYAKIEYLTDELTAMNNQFSVTFFEGNTMYDKKFLFRKNTINTKAFRELPVMNQRGVLAE